MKIQLALCLVLSSFVALSPAQAEQEDEAGTLNPEELTLNSTLKKALRGEVDMMVCAQGYAMTKKGDHEDARALFEKCVDAGYTAAMTWMSYLDQNGLGKEEDPVASAEWDRKAAELGDPIGEFNYGLNLLRGYGVDKNETLGRSYVDRAASNGVKAATQLQESGYDYRSVTPDADEWKYEKNLY